MSKNKPSKKTAREQVRAQVAAQARAEQRMKIVFRSLVGIGVLAVVAVVAAIGLSRGGGGGDAQPTVMASGGISFASHDGVLTLDQAAGDTDTAGITASNLPEPGTQTGEAPHVEVYFDFTCPHCADFEETNASYLKAATTNGDITLEYRPVAIMDRASRGTNWSSRAANAAVCVAEYDSEAYLPVSSALFAARDSALAGQMDDRALVELVQDYSDAGDELDECIRDGDYYAWVMDRTAEALKNPDLVGHTGSFGTPTVVVDGKVYAGSWTNTNELNAFIDAQRGAATR